MTRKSIISRAVFLLLPLFGISPTSDRLIILIPRFFFDCYNSIYRILSLSLFFEAFKFTELFQLGGLLMQLLSTCESDNKACCVLGESTHDRGTIFHRKFVETLALITDDWNDCVKNDIAKRVTTGKAKISDRITNVILVLHTITIATYCLRVIIADTDETIEAPLVNKLELPFSINTQGMYRFVLIAEFMHMILCNWAAGVVNIILLAMVLHTGGQIDILQCWLAELTPREIEDKQDSIVIVINKIISKHQKIIQFSGNIESLYTHIALFLFASNTMLICSLGFLIVTSREIGFAIYNSAWYDLKPKDSRILLLIILRSQKQLMLTAGNMMDLTLESFASIMSASGSYLSVLLAMQ